MSSFNGGKNSLISSGHKQDIPVGIDNSYLSRINLRQLCDPRLLCVVETFAQPTFLSLE